MKYHIKRITLKGDSFAIRNRTDKITVTLSILHEPIWKPQLTPIKTFQSYILKDIATYDNLNLLIQCTLAEVVIECRDITLDLHGDKRKERGIPINAHLI